MKRYSTIYCNESIGPSPSTKQQTTIYRTSNYGRQSLPNFNGQTFINNNPSSSASSYYPRRILTTRRTMTQKPRSSTNLDTLERPFVESVVDACLHLSQKNLANKCAKKNLINLDSIKYFQTEITSPDRRNAIMFMREVCTNENADVVVLPLAVQYLDRILSTTFIPRRSFAPIVGACLFIATKIKAPNPISATQLIAYSNKLFRVTMEELLDFEAWVVDKLNWELSTDTALDFVDQIITRSPLLDSLRNEMPDILSAMHKDLDLATLPAVRQAAALVLYLAEKSKKRHFIVECEEVIRSHLYINAIEIRQKYLTNIQFAVDDIFFDDDINQPLAPRSICGFEPSTAKRACAIFGFTNNNSNRYNHLPTTKNFSKEKEEDMETEDETYIIMTDDDDDDDDDDDFVENQENYYSQQKTVTKSMNNHDSACRNLDKVLAKDFKNPSRQQITPQQALEISNYSSLIQSTNQSGTSSTNSSLRKMNINEHLLSSDTKTNDSGFHSPAYYP